MHKFALPAGTTNRHKWHKEAAKAVAGVTRTFDQVRELWGTKGGDERESLVSHLSFGADDPKNPEAVAIYNELGERFGWQITRDNAADVAEAFREALPRCMESVPVEDHRTTPEQDTERDELRRTQEAERKAEAEAKSDRVEAIAEELRKQYPDAIGPNGKSSQARAAANLKRILQARGLQCSVKSSSFSMGDSVTARVTGPDVPPDVRKELDEIAERFSYSTFDPMTDMSGYKRDDDGEAWRQVFGKTKYCRIEWDRSDEIRAAIAEFLGDETGDEYGDNAGYRVWTGAHHSAAEFWAKWEADHKAPETPTPSGNGYTVEKHHHTKRGFDFWLVVLADRVERDEFTRLRSSCKAAGGWYSRKWGSTPGGFAFTEQERAGAWALQEFGGDYTPPDRPRAPVKDRPDTAKADKFREMADKLDAEVTAKRAPHQENTPKRQREGMSRRIDADRLERTAQGLRALACLLDGGALPPALSRFTSKKAVYEAVGVRTVSEGYYHVAATKERTDESPEAAALWELIGGKDPEQERAERLHDMVTAVKGTKIPGYFPTPEPLVARMVRLADVGPGHAVLEPSAGCGAIVDALSELDADPLIVVHEVNPTLCEILQAKGFDARPSDFLEYNGQFRYDRVLMNPPFENLQDIDHVMHAFTFLKPGGRLVAIMSPGAFYRSSAKADEFRDFCEVWGAEVEDIEAGAFRDSGTGVASKLVVIDRPESDARQIHDQGSAHTYRRAAETKGNQFTQLALI